MIIPRTIYAIQHKPTGRIYIGSSKDAKERCKTHIGALRRGKHPNALMQEDYNKHGEDYSFYILGEITSYDQKIREYEWMERLRTYDPACGYNGKDNHFAKRKGKDMNITFIKSTPISNKAKVRRSE